MALGSARGIFCWNTSLWSKTSTEQCSKTALTIFLKVSSQLDGMVQVLNPQKTALVPLGIIKICLSEDGIVRKCVVQSLPLQILMIPRGTRVFFYGFNI